MHLAPRVLQVSGICSLPIEVCNSIIAGCKHSAALRKAYLKQQYRDIRDENDTPKIQSFVDDTPITAVGMQELVFNSLCDAALCFKYGTQALKLKLFGKAYIVASSFSAARQLQHFLREKGMKFRIPTSARDLGISYTAGKPIHRKRNINKVRIASTKSRSKCTIQIARITKKARKLTSGSVYPASTWGHQSFGISHADVLKIERRAAQSSGLPKGRCRFITLCVAFGPRSHPYARIIMETLELWFQVVREALNTSTIKLTDLRLAWSEIKQERFKLGTKADVLVAGVMGSLTKMLVSLVGTPKHWIGGSLRRVRSGPSMILEIHLSCANMH